MWYTAFVNVTVYQGENFVLTNDHVLQLAAQKLDLQPTLVLVPDRFTLQAERQMLRTRPQLLNTRVVTFSMLYQLVAAELQQGQPATPVVDKTTAVLNLWLAIKQVAPELVWFKASVNHYDFAAKLYNTLNQMRSSCVDFATLAAQAKSPVARKKYHDINLIYQKYRELLAARADSSGMLEYLAANLSRSANIKNTAIYVAGFASLSPAREQVLTLLCRHAASVTIAASEPELLQQVAQYPHRRLSTPKFTPQTYTARCLTERGEAEVVARKIVPLLNQGVTPEKIVVLLNEFTTLAPVWQTVFTEYGIPINVDVGQKLSTTADAKYLRDLLTMLANDDTENTVAVLFNQCNGLGEEIYALDNQIVAGNWRARRVEALKKLTPTKDLANLCEQLKTFTTQTKLQDLLTQLAAFPGLSSLTLHEFSTLFWSLCTATKLSNIPLYTDRVLLASLDEWVPNAVDYLAIVNCTAENFPKGQNDDDILQEADLVGTKITPTPKLQRLRNYRHAMLLQTVATTEVWLSGTCEEFHAADDEPVATTYQIPDCQDPVSTGRELFFPSKHVKTTMVEKFYSCPRLNFWENGLRLHPREIYQLKPNNLGSAIHLALQTYFTNHDLAAAVTAGIQALNYDSPPLQRSLAKEIRFLIQQLETSFAGGKFQIAAVEKDIKQPLAHGLQLVGRIDRVDVAPLADGGQAYLVLDYKTGQVGGGLAKSIYLGNKLQLPLYAAALLKQPTDRIAGAGYLPLSSGYAEDNKKITLKGFIDQDCTDLFAPQLLNPAARQYVDAITIRHLCQTANDLVDAAVTRLLAGEVAATAVEDKVCEYCVVRALCPHAGEHCRGDGVKITFKDFSGVTK